MKYRTTKYVLKKNGKSLEFLSEKEACEFLGVKRCSVASCYRSGAKCKGYDVERLGITTHQASKTRLFKIWQSMHERCERKSHKYYCNYGGRGIAVCVEWQEFEPFRDWSMANGYGEDLTLDRKDVDGNYEPSNCRWVTMKEQQNNKRTNHCLSYNGETHSISMWAGITGINSSTIRERIRAGWSVEKALTEPVRCRTRGYRMSGAKMDGDKE